MPSPIRPVGRETSDLFSSPAEFTKSVDAWGSILENSSEKTAKVNATEKQRSLLLEIWNNAGKSNLEAQKIAGVKDKNLLFMVPRHINAVNLAELAHSGLVVNQGDGMVKLTDAGKKELSREIMRVPSEILKEKTRDRYIYCQMKNVKSGYYLVKVPATVNLQLVIYKDADGNSEIVKIVSVDDIKITGSGDYPQEISSATMMKLPVVLEKGNL